MDAKKIREDIKGLESIVYQHEIDHLEGITILTYVSKLKRSMIEKKLSKTKANEDRVVL